MRARYYNPEIKRFINQDVLTGSITDSPTMNRYAYVNGNPISLSDPFGLSPSIPAFCHAVLDVLGMIPAFGFIFDMINGGWYLFTGHPWLALSSFISAIPAFGEAASLAFKGKSFADKVEKVADYLKFIGNVGRACESSYIVGFTIAANIDRYLVNGEKFSWKQLGHDLLSIGFGTVGLVGGLKRTKDALNGIRKARAAVQGGNDTTRVGRWMSEDEYLKMKKSGYVQKPYNANQSYVANPADYNAFYKQTAKGNVYVEFDVPTSSLKQTKDVWAAIPGPDSMYSKNNIRKGLPPYEFPPVTNIVKKGKK